MTRLPLATLSIEERAHEARVLAAVRAALAAAGGRLSFARFMELALYAPGLGYYAAGAHKLGAGGDFVTAPELTPVFGRCLATQAAEVLAALDGGDVLELGAGSGALAEVLLAGLADAGRLPRRYRILEPSPDLRRRQQLRLAALPAALAARVEWLEAPPPEAFRGLVLANEVADALPVERFRRTADGVLGASVVERAGALALDWAAAEPALAAAVRAVEDALGEPLAAGHEGEFCPSLGAWLAAVAAPLAAGVVLLIDYGAPRRELYAPAHAQGTFACHHRQRRHDDALVHVGLQDLTAWVDFTRLAEAGLEAGFEVAGYTTQAAFLLACDFEGHLARERAAAPPDREPLLARAAARLVLPAQMGETFKCLALVRGYDAPLRGFALRDFTARL